jgi:pimeloyl-ACP methyl ester carboxylesterase
MRSFLPIGVLAGVLSLAGGMQTPQSILLRGHQQTIHIYGSPDGPPIIVSSGDGGWVHLGPHVAQVLADRGFYVVGFDVKAYLASFTSGHTTVGIEDEPSDYRVLVNLARNAKPRKPILVGISEGAGLSVLAASDPGTKAEILGVVGLGLPDMNELGWRFRDSLIYLTHRAPNEPSFSAASIVAGVAPLPFAAIHSTHDEFVPLSDIRNTMERAAEPKRLWIVQASDHRFSDNLAEFDQRLVEAVEWVRANGPH